MHTMGEDFQYANARMWFKNMDKLPVIFRMGSTGCWCGAACSAMQRLPGWCAAGGRQLGMRLYSGCQGKNGNGLARRH